MDRTCPQSSGHVRPFQGLWAIVVRTLGAQVHMRQSPLAEDMTRSCDVGKLFRLSGAEISDALFLSRPVKSMKLCVYSFYGKHLPWTRLLCSHAVARQTSDNYTREAEYPETAILQRSLQAEGSQEGQNRPRQALIGPRNA